MIDYFTNFPKLLRYYVTSFGRNLGDVLFPFRQKPSGALLITPEKSTLLLKNKRKIILFHPEIQDLGGSPTLSITQPHTTFEDPTANTYFRSIQKNYRFATDNSLTIVVNDNKAILAYENTHKYHAAQDVHDALNKSPNEVIASWGDYSNSGQYIWQILAPDLTPLHGDMVVPNYIIICGYPEASAQKIAEWADLHQNQLVNLFSLPTAILLWIKNYGPQGGFFLVVSTENNCTIVYLKYGEIQEIRAHPKHFEMDEIADINDIINNRNLDYNTPVWAWGLTPLSVVHEQMTDTFPHYRDLDTTYLSSLQTLVAPKHNQDFPLDKEAWILNYLTA